MVAGPGHPYSSLMACCTSADPRSHVLLTALCVCEAAVREELHTS